MATTQWTTQATVSGRDVTVVTEWLDESTGISYRATVADSDGEIICADDGRSRLAAVRAALRRARGR